MREPADVNNTEMAVQNLTAIPPSTEPVEEVPNGELPDVEQLTPELNEKSMANGHPLRPMRFAHLVDEEAMDEQLADALPQESVQAQAKWMACFFFAAGAASTLATTTVYIFNIDVLHTQAIVLPPRISPPPISPPPISAESASSSADWSPPVPPLSPPAPHLPPQSPPPNWPPSLPPNLMGGCLSNVPRASYQSKMNCHANTSCTTCFPQVANIGRCQPDHPGAIPHLPSGMQVPRHNVQQYMGNAVWDAQGAINFESALAAMLGDPFQYTASPYLAVLAQLLQGREGEELARSIATSFTIEERYVGVDWSRETRDRFLAVVRSLTRANLTRSQMWAGLPLPILAQLEATPPQSVPPEVAMCAAVLLQDCPAPARRL